MSTPISVNKIRINGELPSHQRILVSGSSLPTVYSDPTRKLVTLSAVATIRSPWISGLSSRLRKVLRTVSCFPGVEPVTMTTERPALSGDCMPIIVAKLSPCCTSSWSTRARSCSALGSSTV